jgi:uncharacterized membrane protein
LGQTRQTVDARGRQLVQARGQTSSAAAKVTSSEAAKATAKTTAKAVEKAGETAAKAIEQEGAKRAVAATKSATERAARTATKGDLTRAQRFERARVIREARFAKANPGATRNPFSKGAFGFKGFTTSGGRAGGTGLVGAAGKAGNVLSRGLGGPVGIATLVASLVGDPIVEGISSAAVGARKKIEGETGFSKEQGGLGQAKLVGGAKGAIQGGAAGAAIGSAFAPVVGTVIGALVGTIAGAITGSEFAELDQIRFDALKDLQAQGGKFASTLEKLQSGGLKNVKALSDVSKEAETLASSVADTQQTLLKFTGSAGLEATGASGLARFQASVGETIGAGIDTEDTFTGKFQAAIDNIGALGAALGGAALGATIGSFILPGIGTAIGAAIGAGVGLITTAIAGGFDGLSGERTAARVGVAGVAGETRAIEKSLNLVSDEQFDKARDAFSGLAQNIAASIPDINLGDFTQGTENVSEALLKVGPQTEEFAAQVRALGSLRKVTLLGDLKKEIENRKQAAGS